MARRLPFAGLVPVLAFLIALLQSPERDVFDDAPAPQSTRVDRPLDRAIVFELRAAAKQYKSGAPNEIDFDRGARFTLFASLRFSPELLFDSAPVRVRRSNDEQQRLERCAAVLAIEARDLLSRRAREARLLSLGCGGAP